MPSRHQIREVAVQLLYSLQMEGKTSPETTDFGGFWEVLQDRDYLKYYSAQTKAIEHIAQDRDNKLALFEERLNIALPLLKEKKDAEILLKLLNALRKTESEWGLALHQLFSTFKSTTDNKSEELGPLVTSLLTINASLVNLRAQVLTEAAPLTSLAAILDPVMGSLRKLQTTGERLDAVARPSLYPDNNDVRHLRNAEAELKKLKEKTTAMVTAVLKEITPIDEALESSIENYSPERLATVDRSVLRLATYEILYTPEIPLSVIISEAVETAACFSGSDSAKFVNGVLNQIGKTYRPS